jgi:hypothetical protein
VQRRQILRLWEVLAAVAQRTGYDCMTWPVGPTRLVAHYYAFGLIWFRTIYFD